MGLNIKITPNKNWRVKSIYTYKPGATKMKRVKGSSVTIPTNYRAFITMENKKNKLTKKLLLMKCLLLKILDLHSRHKFYNSSESSFYT